MKAIVTGGAGFIGSHIAKRLFDEGHEVTVVDDLSAGHESNIPCNVEFLNKDIADPFTYTKLPNCDVIFHNAASKKNVCLKNPVKDAIVNAVGTLRLLEFAKLRGVKKFVHASTGSVYGEPKTIIKEDTPTRPVSIYGISKLTGENYVKYFNRTYGLDTTVLRYFHVYGNNQEDRDDLGGVVAIFMRQLREGKTVTIHGDGDQERVFTYVDDIVDANMASWQNEKSKGRVYNCASIKKTTINALAHILANKLKVTPEIEYGPELEGDIRWFSVDGSAIGEIGVRFRDFNEGIKDCYL